ncbi:MAG: serine/threonine-protein kinase [Prevotella sp.]|nr:serine/threonine-protein kinase [Prevotella sp.]
MHLKQFTLLQGGKYKIERFIASGGFGCTYEAYHTLLDMRVALKEFFVSDFCNRDEKTGQVSVATKSKVELISKLKKKFMDEARSLYKMKHPGIVRVIDVFEENGTAYYVMEYIDGQSLSDVVKKRGKLPEAEAVGYIRQVAEALKYVHSLNRLHLDIKPGNIMLGKDGKAVLIDFGASKHYDDETGENTSTLLGINTKGYAPVEQVNQSFKSFSPATDIYALGATLYKLLTGITPPSSTLLHSEEATLEPLPSTVSPATRKAVDSAMQLLRKNRPQSVEEWMDMFVDDEKTNVDVVVPEPTPALKPKNKPAPFPKPARFSGWKWIISGVLAAIIISVAIWQSGRNEPSDINYNDTVATNQTNAEDSPQQSISGTISGHDYVDLGLSVKWATQNVGASSPSDYGDYFAWGETQTKKRFDWDNCFDCLDDEGISWGTYKIGGKTSISPTCGNDTARENWGGSWRMPTDAEFEELCDETKCEWTWTSQGGHEGYKVTGPNGNSIFLPAAGVRHGTGIFLPAVGVRHVTDNVGESGYYWSSTLSSSDSGDARYLTFVSGGHYTYDGGRRSGHSVRPVAD